MGFAFTYTYLHVVRYITKYKMELTRRRLCIYARCTAELYLFARPASTFMLFIQCVHQARVLPFSRIYIQSASISVHAVRIHAVRMCPYDVGILYTVHVVNMRRYLLRLVSTRDMSPQYTRNFRTQICIEIILLWCAPQKKKKKKWQKPNQYFRMFSKSLLFSLKKKKWNENALRIKKHNANRQMHDYQLIIIGGGIKYLIHYRYI